MTVEEFRTYCDTSEPDAMISVKLQALEQLIRKTTNNNFQNRNRRVTADIISGSFSVGAYVPFKEGDTVQITESCMNEGLYTVNEVSGTSFTVKEDVDDESNVLVTRIDYPVDVKIGAVNMMKWDMENREKVGIQSETISRHSVTYFNMDGENSSLGYPKSLTGFLKPYMKARF